MKHTYIKPESTLHIVEASPILNASYGDRNAQQDQPVLSKRHNRNSSCFEDDFEDENFDDTNF